MEERERDKDETETNSTPFHPNPTQKVADFRGSDARMIEMGCKQTLFAAIKLHGRGREEMAKLKKRENLKTMSRMPILDKGQGETKAVLRAATRALEEKGGDDNPGMTVAALKRLEKQVADILSTVESISKVDEAEDSLSPLPLQSSAPVSVGVGTGDVDFSSLSPFTPPPLPSTAPSSSPFPALSFSTNPAQPKCFRAEKQKPRQISLSTSLTARHASPGSRRSETTPRSLR